MRGRVTLLPSYVFSHYTLRIMPTPAPRPAINFAYIAGVAYAAYDHMANMTV